MKCLLLLHFDVFRHSILNLRINFLAGMTVAFFVVGWPILNSKQKLRQKKHWRRNKAQRLMVVPWSLITPVRRANKKIRKVCFQINSVRAEGRTWLVSEACWGQNDLKHCSKAVR